MVRDGPGAGTRSDEPPGSRERASQASASKETSPRVPKLPGAAAATVRAWREATDTGTAGGVAFPLDEVLHASPGYRWTMNHTLRLDGPLELFPCHVVDVGR